MGRVEKPGPDERAHRAAHRLPCLRRASGTPGAHLFCMNRKTCKPQAVARLSHFASRNAMDIDTFSDKTAELLYDRMGLRDCADLYSLTANDLLALDGFKQKRAENLIAAIEKSRHCALDAFLFALGIPNVGRKTAKDLAASLPLAGRAESRLAGETDGHSRCGGDRCRQHHGVFQLPGEQSDDSAACWTRAFPRFTKARCSPTRWTA